MRAIIILMTFFLLLTIACTKDNHRYNKKEERTYAPKIETGLIGFWPLDGDAKDYSGNKLHGLIRGKLFLRSRDDSNSSFAKFNANSITDIKRIDVNNHTDLHLQSNFTLSCWIRIDNRKGGSTVQDYEFLSKWGPSGEGFASYVLGVNGDDKFYLGTYRDRNTTVYSEKKISLEEWHHVAATFDEGLGTLYIDGEYAGSQSNMDIPQVSITDLSFGARPDNLSTFNGLMDDIYIFERTLTANEIKVLYQN